MLKNKVRNIVVVALVFIVALHIANYFKDQKPVKTEKRRGFTFDRRYFG